MKKCVYFLLPVLFSCNQYAKDASSKDSTIVLTSPPVAETRTVVKKEPAAGYSQPIPDEMNNGWKFSVNLYETQRTFHYTVRIQAKEVRITDSVNIPDFGTEPRVDVRKGKDPLTCIIGFLDKKDVFQEYREVSFKDDRLRVRTLHTYSVGTYRVN